MYGRNGSRQRFNGRRHADGCDAEDTATREPAKCLVAARPPPRAVDARQGAASGGRDMPPRTIAVDRAFSRS